MQRRLEQRRQRAGDGDALALAAGKLMGIATPCARLSENRRDEPP
jgi:hypothetical protein